VAPVIAPTMAYLRKFQRLGEGGGGRGAEAALGEGGGGGGRGAEAVLVQRNRFDANEIARDRRIPNDMVGFLWAVTECKRKRFK